MNPLEAFQYMKTTGKPVKADKTPNFIRDPNWVKLTYTVENDQIIRHLDDYEIDREDLSPWLNWWMNFCYNTNSSSHNVELIPV